MRGNKNVFRALEELGVSNPKHQIVRFLEDQLTLPPSSVEGDVSGGGGGGGGGAAGGIFANLVWYEEGFITFSVPDGEPVNVLGRGALKDSGAGTADIEYSFNGGSWTTFPTTLGSPIALADNSDELRVRVINADNVIDFPFRTVLILEAV